MKNKTTLGIVAAMAAAMAPEHMVYDLGMGHTGIGPAKKQSHEPKVWDQEDVERIRMAENKRLRRNAKRLKQRNT